MEVLSAIHDRFDQFLERCKALYDEKSVQDICRAIEFSKEILDNKTFDSGEIMLEHSLEVASIIAEEIGLESDSVVTGILHNVMYPHLEKRATSGLITEQFGQSVSQILEGMAKINALGTDTVDLYSENYRMLMLALAGDVRVIIIKIADRLQVMRNFDRYPSPAVARVTSETSHLYAPLAHRLGLYKINSELQDLCLKYQKPEAYQEVVMRLKETENERSKFVAEFVKPIEEKLRSRGFHFDMKARTKSVFSIWNKMQKQNVSFDEVYDLFAIRVILDSKPADEKADCWTVYSVVTEEYQANPERLRDWITIPKSNGYESLHTTVMGPHKKWVEVQIRTKRMDEIAEKGLAAHWKYKGGKGSRELDEWLAGIRDILENPEVNVVNFIDEFRKDVYGDEIFVFTPKGELKKLPRGATILDFAYEIHSALGDKCVGGKVNDKKVTLRHRLKNGDTVSVETSNNQKPKIDWLDIVVTSKAKNRVRASLNEARKREAANGKEILVRKFKNWKIEFSDEVIRKLLKHYGFKLAADLYFQVSVGKIDTLAIKTLLKEEEKQNVRSRLEEILPAETVRDLTLDSGDDYMIIDNNIKNVNYKLAPCCNPVFGDEIFGFVTIREGIKIHRTSCPNAPQMVERFPYRIIKARWRNTSVRSSFLATLHISGTDQIGIVSEISNAISRDTGVQMRSINVESDRGEFRGTLKVWVYNVEHLDFLIYKLRNIKGVTSVSRSDR
ncbi:MAG TPA: RelA/SpoT family protein [Prolixibacteraceae bacterium]|nr:RelA/SpoT family protein [Prolixibacteraceae bacterium]